MSRSSSTIRTSGTGLPDATATTPQIVILATKSSRTRCGSPELLEDPLVDDGEPLADLEIEVLELVEARGLAEHARELHHPGEVTEKITLLGLDPVVLHELHEPEALVLHLRPDGLGHLAP